MRRSSHGVYRVPNAIRLPKSVARSAATSDLSEQYEVSETVPAVGHSMDNMKQFKPLSDK